MPVWFIEPVAKLTVLEWQSEQSCDVVKWFDGLPVAVTPWQLAQLPVTPA
jgi:hypothetical protein